MQEFYVEPADAGVRADIFVASRYPKFTRSSLEALFDQELIQINGAVAKPSQKTKPGDKVEVDETLLNLVPPAIDLPVIYEDDNVIVINKPAGVLTHSKGALNLEGTVASFIADKVSSDLSGNRAGIVHRLDRATSGVIIAAKNVATQSKLQKQFSQRLAKKTYLAVVEGTLEPAEAVIDVPIERNPKRPQTFRAGASGKPAQTAYKVLKTFGQGIHKYTLLELKPTTGRTHQLRVHLAYIGHPIVGDYIYGHEAEQMLLQAKSLEITLPGGHRQVFKAPDNPAIMDFSDA